MLHVVQLTIDWQLQKFRDGDLEPYETLELGLNGVTTIGCNNLADVMSGLGGVPLSAANSFIGVGDNNAAFNVAQTDLQSPLNKIRKPMMSGFPSRSAQTLTYRSNFTTAEANYSWEEWGIFWNLVGASMVSRRVQSIGTKTSSDNWTLTGSLSLVPG